MNKTLSRLSKHLPSRREKLCSMIAANTIHLSSSNERVLNVKTMNENIFHMEYAVRGPIVLRAVQIEDELRMGVKKPFDHVIRANIGDAHATGQKPVTFLRQFMAICTLPELLNEPEFPNDVKEKARRFLNDCKGFSVGAYTESEGIRSVRQDVARFIERRDEGVPCDWQNIHLTTGASDAIKSIREILLTSRAGKKAGFMIPVPQYPFYTATIREFNAHPIGYYLDEEKNWGLDIDELEKAYEQSKAYCEPRAIVVINPGNPTGQVLSKENIKKIIKFAHDKNLFIMADEVYQDNIYAADKFHSFKKVASQMSAPYANVEIASFYSTSKGFMGECGARSGYLEVFNLDPEVKIHLDKLASVRLCSSAIGQACMAGVVNPPQPGEESFNLFEKEKNAILNSLKEKAHVVTSLLNRIEGVSCNTVQGAMYAFPRITIPKRAIDKAHSLNMHADVFYCFQLLEQTGICVVPGSGFRQKPGTYHFRTTILPSIEEIKSALGKFEKFHVNFTSQWS